MADPSPAPAPWHPFRRAAISVVAERLRESLEWTSSSGAVLHGEPGHWKLWEPDGSGKVWTITDEDFRETYEPGGDGLFRSRGRVLARPARSGEVVDSKEGPAEAGEGDWVVQRAGHRWLVPTDEFHRRYRPDPGDSHSA